jgi:glycosyltransferase involved in cell wall biosynthesis
VSGQPTVIIVNDFAHVEGGASQVALSSASGLGRRGYSVVLFSAVAPVPSACVEHVKVVCTQQHEVIHDPVRARAALQGLWNVTAAKEFRNLLRELDPSRTIVHVHGWTKSLSSSVIRSALDAGFMIVCTLHDYFIACPNGSFFNYSTDRICRLEPLSPQCIISNCDSRSYGHKLWRVARQIVQKTSGKMPYGLQHFITVSDFSEAILRPFLSPQTSVYRVPNPINVSREPPVLVVNNESFVMIGRLSNQKAPLLFAQAASRLGLTPVFVGEGECREEILKQNPTAVITGWCSSSDVMQHMKRARGLVFPSLWYETQGLVVLEAAAHGVPAIVSDNCAAREAVLDGVTGLWFKGGSVNDLAEKLQLLLEDARVSAVGQGAYNHYWENPTTLDRHVDELEVVYQRMLGL